MRCRSMGKSLDWEIMNQRSGVIREVVGNLLGRVQVVQISIQKSEWICNLESLQVIEIEK
jgi:hypothetical protein